MAQSVRIVNQLDEYISLNVDYPLEISRGNISGISSINKFGKAPSGIQTTATDIWSRADATPTQQIWVAPTTARQHNIVSTSTDDDGSPVGVGARTIRIWGLTSWSTAESSEDITMDGTSNVLTASSYVIIHRMKVLTAGNTSINVGTITATAATDASVTAVILPNEGQTQMAIYGVPSTQSFYITKIYASLNDATASSRVDIRFSVNESPNVSPLNVRFILKGTFELSNQGSSYVDHTYEPPFRINGPCIVKLQGISNSADEDVSGGFDGYLVTN